MPVNPYFNNYNSIAEQSLIEDLIIETIKMYGMNINYLPRTLGAEDLLLNEDDLSTFTVAQPIETYIKNVDGFEGEGDFLSKFGLQIRDSMTLSIAQRRFNTDLFTQVRPNEGDLIFFPLNGKMFEVMHVEHEAIFYQFGKLQTYDLRVELFEYSGERFNTGVPEIDDRYTSYDMTSNTALANVEVTDAFADNSTIEDEGDVIIDFTINNPYGDSQY